MPIDPEVQKEQRKMAEELLFSGEKLPSFAKSLFLGVCDAKRVFPFPEVDPVEHRRVENLIEELRAFCKSVAPSSGARPGCADFQERSLRRGNNTGVPMWGADDSNDEAANTACALALRQL